MKSILYFPDGNRRYAKKNNLSLLDSYVIGLEKSLGLFSEYFLVEKDFNSLIFVIYTYVRKDSSYNDVCKACEIVLERFLNNNFFQKHSINFKVIDHFGEFPNKLTDMAKRLSDSTKNECDKQVIFLLGYSLEEDFNRALSTNPLNYEGLRKGLIFPDIDLAIRNAEMRLSNGPIYAMGKTQLMKIDKLNPEVTKEDLDDLWKEYLGIEDYRKSLN